MKTLFPAQQQALARFAAVQGSGRNTLDASMVGTGKTVVAAHLAKTLGCPVAVVCPKAVIPSWKRELAETGLEPVFVLNYEKIRNGKTPYLTKAFKKVLRWVLPPDTLLIFDEVHKCKGMYTLNAQLLISAVQAKLKVHLLSATACQDPTEMRALGYALGLHSLNNSNGTLRSFNGWLWANGCKQDLWNSWYLADKTVLDDLHQKIYGPAGAGYRLSVRDFPDSFRQNHIHMLPVAGTAKLKKAYSSFNSDDLVRYIEDEVTPDRFDETDDEPFIVKLLRARQEAELEKVPDLVALAEDFLEQNLSVAIFVNFRETARLLAEGLQCGVIEGGQRSDYRQQLIDDFQAGRVHTLVVNIEAGGTGLSLHHTAAAARQRVSLISPTFNAKSHLQVLGRTHRNGALTDSLQYIVVGAGTVEESVVAAVDKKCQLMAQLHGLEYEKLSEDEN